MLVKLTTSLNGAVLPPDLRIVCITPGERLIVRVPTEVVIPYS